jgi:hypothetical protein
MAASKKSNHKKDSAGNGGRAALYTIGLVVLAFALIAVSSFLFPRFGGMNGRAPQGDFGIPPRGLGVFTEDRLSFDMYNYFLLRFAFGVVNVALVIYLLFVYVKDYMRLKAKFTLGIIAFLFSFLLYALSSLPLLPIVLGPNGRDIFSFVPMLFSAIGLLIFAKLSNE